MKLGAAQEEGSRCVRAGRGDDEGEQGSIYSLALRIVNPTLTCERSLKRQQRSPLDFPIFPFVLCCFVYFSEKKKGEIFVRKFDFTSPFVEFLGQFLVFGRRGEIGMILFFQGLNLIN